MRVKMQTGGTAPTGNLCDSCKFSSKIIFQNGKEVVRCAVFEKNLNADVGHCSAHKDKNFVNIYEMKDQAWIIEISKANKIGFTSPDKRSEKQTEEIDDLGYSDL